ncbi:hypothetical protein WISP_00779 [Willisornis vidua]|uniref:Uncharacterized protein n=1 Tax=Willisornis vidua TaxID=1566151 RepID=A0ABQ9DW85_9PASS|nr:hypothetical protein WISP_00779 [Willisornis vidua]
MSEGSSQVGTFGGHLLDRRREIADLNIRIQKLRSGIVSQRSQVGMGGTWGGTPGQVWHLNISGGVWDTPGQVCELNIQIQKLRSGILSQRSQVGMGGTPGGHTWGAHLARGGT